MGLKVGEYGRNLFWTPLGGVIEYELDARESGGDRADYQGGITCLDTLERCDYLLDEDRRTSEAFRAAPELRVRAVTEEGVGPWSEWVSVGKGPPGRVEGLRYGWSLTEGLVLLWDSVDGTDRYEVEGREAGRTTRPWTAECEKRVCSFLADEAGSGIWEGVFVTATEFRVRAVKGSIRAKNPLKGQWSDWLTVEPAKPRQVRHVWYGVESPGPRGTTRDIVSWSPLRGAESYDLQYQYFDEVFGTVVYDDIKLVEDVARYGNENQSGKEECRGLLRCEYEFLRNRDRRVQVRVRAENALGLGPWSEWVESVRRPEGVPTIYSLAEVHHTFSHNDVKVSFSHVWGSVAYRLEWRYIDYHGDAGSAISAHSNADRVKEVVEWMDDPENYVVRKQGSTIVDSGGGTAKGVLNDDAEKWILEFRVVALGDDDTARASDWTRWNTQQLKDKLEEDSTCGALGILDAGNQVFDIVNVVLALYSGGLGAGVLTALKTQLSFGPDGVKAAQVLEGCFRDHHPIDVLKELSPMVGVILDITGMTAVVKGITCGNHYLATNFKDKNFDVDDIDGLLQACYTKR